MAIFSVFCVLCFVCAAVTQEINSTGTEDVENRWGFFNAFDQLDQQSCVTGYSEPGQCVNLRRCPRILSQVRHLNPGRIFENLQEYTEPCPFRGQVCCPERRQVQWNPDPSQQLQTSTENFWKWPNTWTTAPFAVPATTKSWRDILLSTTTKKPKQIKVPSSKTKHKNRKLLPERDCGMSLDIRIIGGKETDLEEHPWMALLRLRLPNGRSAFACGGSIISSLYVLTAAHCLKGSGIPTGAFPDIVRVGEHDMGTERDCRQGGCNTQHQDIPVQKQIIHPQFTPTDPATYNDIALIRLKSPVIFNRHVVPVCLPLDGLSTAQYDGKKLTTVGWGRTSNAIARNSPIKLKVAVPVVPFSRCSPVYSARKIQLRDTQMCAGGETGKDSCQGDSGGPLLSYDSVGLEKRWHIQGIVSTGPKDCGKADMPALYTRVAKYVTWILDNIQP